MSLNDFAPEKFYDHKIVDEEGLTVGRIRVKPSGIHWKPKNSKKWYGLTLEEFAEFAEGKRKRLQK